MDERSSQSAGTCPISWPQPREERCPLDPPAAGLQAAAIGEPTRVTLWDGSTPWFITRYDDVRALLRDPRLSAEVTKDGFPSPSQKAHQSRTGQRHFQRMDEPEHNRQRRMVASWFSAAAVEESRGFVEVQVDRLLGRMRAAGNRADFVRSFATMVPATVICSMLDLPLDLAEFFDDRINTWTSLVTRQEDGAQALADILEFFDGLIEERLDSEADDLVSRLIREQVEPGHLTKEQLQHILHLILVGGFDTTANMLSLGTLVLLQHPDQLAMLREKPEMWPQAIEELLRYLSVTQHVAYRYALDDIEIGGITIKAGDGVVAPVNLANRDPSAYPEPNRLDVTRQARNHLAFGFGPHQCLGQQLARIELQVAFPRIFDQLPGLRVAREPVAADFKDSLFFGMTELELTWDDVPVRQGEAR